MLGTESLTPTVLTFGPSRTEALHGAVRLLRWATPMSSSLAFCEKRVVVMYRLRPSFVIQGWVSSKGPLITGPMLTGADHAPKTQPCWTTSRDEVREARGPSRPFSRGASGERVDAPAPLAASCGPSSPPQPTVIAAATSNTFIHRCMWPPRGFVPRSGGVPGARFVAAVSSTASGLSGLSCDEF